MEAAMSETQNPVNTIMDTLGKVAQPPSVDLSPLVVTNGNSKLDVTKPIPPRQQKKPFWKSKGFWGGALTIGSAFLPSPVAKVVSVAAGALGVYGRATAQGPLTTQGDSN
jgi:hypothetical protein